MNPPLMNAAFRSLALLVLTGAPHVGYATEPPTSATKPLKVFILAGQSNMQGHAHVRTIEAMRLNPQAAPLLKMMLGPDSLPRTAEKSWISSVGSADEERVGRLAVGYGASANGPKIGPEFTFGLAMEARLDEPILIIKTAWGGKSLNTDFRPPSAGDYEFTDEQLAGLTKRGKDIDQVKSDKAAATGRYYRLMINHIQTVLADILRVYPDYEATAGYTLAGCVWFQGWNDMVDRDTYPHRGEPGGYDQYSQLLRHLIRDLRRDLDAPELPVVIGVMGVGGVTSAYGPEQQSYRAIHQTFRDAMAAPASDPEFDGNVVAVLTENYWDADATRLRKREQTLKAKIDAIKSDIKAGTLARDEGQASIDKLYATTFDRRELDILQQSTSNFDFHYMGSAGIMAQIGNGFAEAMHDLIRAPAVSERSSPRQRSGDCR